jgi:hypothetical protein
LLVVSRAESTTIGAVDDGSCLTLVRVVEITVEWAHHRRDELTPTADLELVEDRFEVILDGVFADPELAHDLARGAPVQHKFGDAALCGCQAVSGEEQ